MHLEYLRRIDEEQEWPVARGVAARGLALGRGAGRQRAAAPAAPAQRHGAQPRAQAARAAQAGFLIPPSVAGRALCYWPLSTPSDHPPARPGPARPVMTEHSEMPIRNAAGF